MIVHTSLEQGIVPDVMHVIHVLKANVKESRPIVLLPNVSKVLDRLCTKGYTRF